MKKSLLHFAGLISLLISITNYSFAQAFVPNQAMTEIDSTLTRTDIGGLSVCLPKDCKFNKEISSPDEGNFVWMTPDKKQLFICCLFETNESFSQEERLIGEAAQMGLELTGDRDIFNMKLDETMYMSFTATSSLSIGVCELFPEDNVGICLFVIKPESNEDSMTVFNIITSVRLSEKQ